jgi:hypothetical protein
LVRRTKTTKSSASDIKTLKCNLTHCGRVTEIYVFTFQPCRTGDVNLRF